MPYLRSIGNPSYEFVSGRTIHVPLDLHMIACDPDDGRLLIRFIRRVFLGACVSVLQSQSVPAFTYHGLVLQM